MADQLPLFPPPKPPGFTDEQKQKLEAALEDYDYWVPPPACPVPPDDCGSCSHWVRGLPGNAGWYSCDLGDAEAGHGHRCDEWSFWIGPLEDSKTRGVEQQARTEK